MNLGIFAADDYTSMRYPSKFSFYACTPPSCTCALVVFHPISLIINHSCSSSCRWWCRKFIFFLLHTIICMCHFITLTIIHHNFPSCIPSYAQKLPAVISLDLCVFRSLITTLLFPFSLHMPLIITFSSGPWLCWSLITAFSVVGWVVR